MTDTPPTEPTVVVTKPADTSVTVSTTKPQWQQVTNYIGAALLGAAGYVVANPALLAAVIPPPWGAVALAALGAVSMAVQEKQKVTVK